MEAWLHFQNPTQIQLSLIIEQKQDLLINLGEARSHLLLKTSFSLNSVIYGDL